MKKEVVVTLPKDHIREIRQRFSVQRLCLFGSVVRDESVDDSDVDVLVVFSQKPTFDRFMDLKFYLEELLGTRVDLVTDKALRPQVRQAIEGEIVDVA
jgi:predicted nucleotidyltransferase